MMLETQARHLVQQLRSAGRRPPEHLVERILAFDPEQIRSALLELAGAIDTLNDEEPQCWGPIHALRLLGEIPDPGMIIPLFTYGRVAPVDIYDTTATMWAIDMFQIAARCGAAAIPLLWSLVDNEQTPLDMLGMSCHTLPFVSVVAPETRDNLIAATRQRLEHADKAELVANLILILAYMGVQEAYADVMAAYRTGRANTSILPAAGARKLLMGGGHALLGNAQLSFWERYERTGPFPEM